MARVSVPRSETASVRDDIVAKVADRLTHRFPASTLRAISTIVAEEYDLLRASPIRTYVPNLVEHRARGRLRHAA